MKTFETVKDEIAIKNNFSCWVELIDKTSTLKLIGFEREAAELYAQQFKDEIDHLKGQVFQFQGMLRMAEEEIRKYRQQ